MWSEPQQSGREIRPGLFGITVKDRARGNMAERLRDG